MLGYCTNVHSGSSFKDAIANLHKFSNPVRKLCQQPIGIGLWLSDLASREVDIPQLKDTLKECDLTLFTLNGFPFSDFHTSTIQHRVYEPHWGDQSRLEYTIRLATILASVIDTEEAGISTLPLCWNTSTCTNEIAAIMLKKCIEQLEEIENKTGRCIHLDIETEPGCRLQRASDVSLFVNKYFNDDEKIRRYLRICHDTCHAAVMRETAEDAVSQYNNAGLTIGKIQLSSAIHINFDEVAECNKQQISDATRQLIEPRYLHQTTIEKSGTVEFFENLTDAPLVHPHGDWLIHFHVPIHLKKFGVLETTQADLLRSIPVLKEAGATSWEVETYTWDVVPSRMKEDELVDSIAKELTWAAQHIKN